MSTIHAFNTAEILQMLRTVFSILPVYINCVSRKNKHLLKLDLGDHCILSVHVFQTFELLTSKKLNVRHTEQPITEMKK